MFAVVAQLVEHILGKDEVGSSSLLNSSKRQVSTRSLSFFVFKVIAAVYNQLFLVFSFEL